jgi:hypothetical protein
VPDLFQTENTVRHTTKPLAFSTRDWFPIASLSRWGWGTEPERGDGDKKKKKKKQANYDAWSVKLSCTVLNKMKPTYWTGFVYIEVFCPRQFTLSWSWRNQWRALFVVFSGVAKFNSVKLFRLKIKEKTSRYWWWMRIHWISSNVQLTRGGLRYWGFRGGVTTPRRKRSASYEISRRSGVSWLSERL